MGYSNMTYDNFTVKAQESILKDQQSVDTVHLIKGVIETDEELTDFLFKKMGVNTISLKKNLNKAIESFPKVEGTDKQYLTNDSNAALSRAKKLIKEFEDDFISVEIVLLSILKGKDKAARILKDEGATEKGMKMAIHDLRKGRKVTDQQGDNQYNALKKFAINLNQRVMDGKLDPIIGRDEEIRRILHILSRRK